MKLHLFQLFFIFLLCVNFLGCAQTPQRLVIPYTDGNKESFVFLPIDVEVFSKTINWKNHFSVYVDNGHECCNGRVPIQGTYKRYKGDITFKPDFPFMEGTTYRIRVKYEYISDSRDLNYKRIAVHGHDYIEILFTPQVMRFHTPTEVVDVYPHLKELPENLFRFYIYFSSPMRSGFSSEFIKLFNEEGREVKNVFMQFKQELWSPDQKRLTLLFDPGRIKRGVSTNMDLGAALVAGKSYKLMISKQWQDATGKPLKANFNKVFQVVSALRTPPDPQQWKLSVPAENSFEPVSLHLNRPFDHALLGKMIKVMRAGEIVGRTIEINKLEMGWRFIPDFPWKKGNYTLVVDSTLEDVAGNNLRGVLDRPVEKKLNEANSIHIPLKI